MIKYRENTVSNFLMKILCIVVSSFLFIDTLHLDETIDFLNRVFAFSFYSIFFNSYCLSVTNDLTQHTTKIDLIDINHGLTNFSSRKETNSASE